MARWSSTTTILDAAIHCLGRCPELGSGSVGLLPHRTWAMAGHPPARLSTFVPTEPLGTVALRATPPLGLLLPAAACLLRTHLEIMAEE